MITLLQNATDAMPLLFAAALSSLTKGLALFLAGLLVTTLVRKMQPAQRANIWLLVIAGTVLFAAAWTMRPSGLMGLPHIHSPAFLSVPGTHSASTAPSMANPAGNNELPAPPVVRATGSRPVLRMSIPPFTPLLIWLSVALLLLVRILYGRLRVERLLGQSHRSGPAESIASESYRTPGQTPTVQVWVCRECAIPFTFGVRPARIVVPAGFPRWAAWKQRAILLHELEHIGRKDSLINLLTAVMCSFFWFVPTAWLARRFLLREQDLACDENVLSAGVRGADYATGIVELVRGAAGQLMMPEGFASFGRLSMLRHRIVQILAWPQRQDGNRPRAGRVITLAFCLLLPVICLGGADFVPGNVISSSPNFFAIAARGTPEQVAAAVQAGARVNGRAPGAGHTPLMVAASSNPDPSVIRALLAAGARIDMRESFTGMTALLFAARNNPNPAVISALLEAGAGPDEADNAKYSALMIAVENPNPDVVLVLLRAGADVNAARTDGTTALMDYARCGNDPGTITLLLREGADARLRSKAGYTALDLARLNPKLNASIARKELEQAQF